jgi:hypothetical protein
MSRSRIAAALVLSMGLASAASLRADVRSDQKTKFQLAGALGKVVSIFGGKAAREGVTSTQALKGNRKITYNDATGQIVDLSEEKVYDLDMKKKTYKVTTFAELRRKMEEEQKKAEDEAKKQQASEPASGEPARDPNQKDLEVDFDIKNTGQSKTINGFNTNEEVVTVTVREKGKTLEEGGGMVMTSDMWLTPVIPAMKELSDFDMKYYQQLYGPMLVGASPQDMAMAMAMYPMVKQAMGKMTAEGGRISGTPIMTTMTFDSVKSAEEMAQEQSAKNDQSSSSSSTSGSGLAGRLAGRLAGAAAKKNDAPQARATFITATSEVLKVTTDVSAADVAVPAGFKENK